MQKIAVFWHFVTRFCNHDRNRDHFTKKNFFLYIKNPFILILRPSKTKRRGFTYNCGFVHLLTPLQPLNAWTVSISLRESNSICPNFILSPREAFSEHSVMDFFHPLFLLKKGVTKKKFFFS